MPDPLDLRQVNDSLFTATLDGVEVCRVSIARADGAWEMYRTVTLPAYEGRGIAGALVRFALDAAERAGVRVIPSCWYVDGLMQRASPRYDHLRVGFVAPATQDPACRIGPAVLPAPGSDPAGPG